MDICWRCSLISASALMSSVKSQWVRVGLSTEYQQWAGGSLWRQYASLSDSSKRDGIPTFSPAATVGFQVEVPDEVDVSALYAIRPHHGDSWMESKALLKCIKFIAISFWNSILCLMMFRNMKICSLQEHPSWNPACQSTSFCNLPKRRIHRTLPENERKVMHLQLFQLLRSQSHRNPVSFWATLGPPCFRSWAGI